MYLIKSRWLKRRLREEREELVSVVTGGFGGHVGKQHIDGFCKTL